MKYVIYKMVQPDELKEYKPDGYYSKTIYRDVLQRLDIHGVEDEHSTMESAITEIENEKDRLKHLKLTILPVITISWDGEIH